MISKRKRGRQDDLIFDALSLEDSARSQFEDNATAELSQLGSTQEAISSRELLHGKSNSGQD